MKEYVSIPTLSYRDVAPQLIDDLVAIYPEGEQVGGSISGLAAMPIRTFCFINVPREDQRVEQVFAVFRKHGWFPYVDKRLPRQPNEYRLVLKRKYTHNDLAKCEFLTLNGKRGVLGLGWRTDREGIIVLPVNRIRKVIAANADTLWTDRPGWMVVSERVRRAVEDTDMRHVIFRPTVLVHGKGKPDDLRVAWSEIGDPWWEITSDYTLPPLSPTVQIVAQDEGPFVSYESQLLELREGLYQVPELHYRRTDIEQCEPFDLAVSHEHIGKPPHQQMKIASQRLYQLFTKHGMKASWIPVRIDD